MAFKKGTTDWLPHIWHETTRISILKPFFRKSVCPILIHPTMFHSPLTSAFAKYLANLMGHVDITCWVRTCTKKPFFLGYWMYNFLQLLFRDTHWRHVTLLVLLHICIEFVVKTKIVCNDACCDGHSVVEPTVFYTQLDIVNIYCSFNERLHLDLNHFATKISDSSSYLCHHTTTCIFHDESIRITPTLWKTTQRC